MIILTSETTDCKYKNPGTDRRAVAAQVKHTMPDTTSVHRSLTVGYTTSADQLQHAAACANKAFPKFCHKHSPGTMSNRQLLCGHAAQLKEFNSVDKVKSCQLAWEPKPALCYCLIYKHRCCPQLMGALTALTSSHPIHHLLSTTWNSEKLSHSFRITIPYCLFITCMKLPQNTTLSEKVISVSGSYQCFPSSLISKGGG